MIREYIEAFTLIKKVLEEKSTNEYVPQYNEHYAKIEKHIKGYIQKYPELFSEEFDSYCIENILPIINEIEPRESLKGNPLAGTIIFYAFLIMMIIGIIAPILFIPSFILFIITIVIVKHKLSPSPHDKIERNKKKDKADKKKILPILFSFYKSCNYISEEEEKSNFKSCLNDLILLKGVSYEVEDYFKIKYDGTDIEMCELNFSTEIPEFLASTEGLDTAVFFRIKAASDFVSRTIVVQKEGLFRREIQGMDTTKLEDDEFNELFDVYTTNHIDARRLMSLSRTEILRENHWLGKEIALSYENGYVNIAFCANKDYAFEIGCLNKDLGTENIKYLRYMIIDLIEYLTVVDALKLGTLV